MGSLLRGLLSLLLTVAAVFFALANRVEVPIVWSPIHPSYDIPVFGIALGALLIGFVFGGIFVWMGAAPLRKDRRHMRKTIKQLEKELHEAKPELPIHYAESHNTDDG